MKVKDLIPTFKNCSFVLFNSENPSKNRTEYITPDTDIIEFKRNIYYGHDIDKLDRCRFYDINNHYHYIDILKKAIELEKDEAIKEVLDE